MTALERGDLLRWRLGAFQRQVERTRTAIREMLRVCARPYVAVSGGKDSLVVLDLVREQVPTLPAIWSDDELEYPETVDSLHTVPGLTVVQGWAQHAGWFEPWRAEPFWRAPSPMMAWIGQRIEDWAPGAGFDGVFLGLRGQEKAKRRLHLASHGRQYRTALGWRFNPIAWWSVADVWAYIAGRGLTYNPVYDRLAAIDVPRAQQRVGPLPLTPGWMLRSGWPELYRRLVERYGERWSN